MTDSPWTTSQYSLIICCMSKEIKILEKIGANVKAIRKQKKLTQEELAELCDFDPTYISMIERGKRNAPILTIAKIAKKLKCKVSELTDI